MGLHTGAPAVTSEGYVGVDLHRGARVAALAHGGQIVVSPVTAALLDGRHLRDLGIHRLKDFEGATRLSQLGEGTFPPLRTPGSVELPTPATRFVGRERELFQAVSLVYDRDPRVLTVVGPGGTGKTRFAIELARLLADEAEGGTIFVPLAPLRDADLVVPALADRLGAASPEVAAVATRVGDRRTHAVVDNVEHLLPHAARPLAELAGAAPALRLLVTSREALRVQGEHELDLPPLADDEAVQLFCERARAVRADVRESAAVRNLCARLDQLPLALELAAARTKLLSPEALLERLGDRLDLLKGARDVDARHATLRATIAWSYDLLDSEEQRLFRRLSVFRGGCTLETAEQVCDAEVDALESLLDKSLLRRRTGRLGEGRLWMLETIREFAAELLDASGEADAVRRRHTERMLEIVSSAHLSEDDDEPFDLDAVLAEREDVRAALDWASEREHETAVLLAVLLENFWVAHAREEGLERLRDLLERPDPVPLRLRARALRGVGNTAFFIDDELTYSAWEESLRLFRELDDDRGVALLLHRLALRPMERGDLEGARRLLDESQALAAGRFPFVETVNLGVYSELALDAGRPDEAVELARRSAQAAQELGWSWWEAGQRDDLCRLAVHQGRLEDAEREGRMALSIARAQENRRRSASVLAGLAQAALARGELERAGRLWGVAEDEQMRAPDRHEESRTMRRSFAWFSGALATETRPEFVAGYQHGRGLDLWDGAAIALGELEPPQTVP
jgi:predicted ATPase